MSRPLRIEYPGALYHVTSRGNARAAIFADDADRLCLLRVLGSVVERHGWRIHAYCLMGNHYHLLAETPRADLSRGMRWLNGVYTQRFNRRHARVGHVFQGRFHAVLVERDCYLLELARYIVLNPVRAGVTRAPQDWPWSSYRATAGNGASPLWLSSTSILEQFAAEREAARQRYREFVAAGVDCESPWSELRAGVLLGTETFVRSLTPMLGDPGDAPETPREQRHAHRPSLVELFAAATSLDRARRNGVIREAHMHHGYTLAEIARHLGLHYATVSRAANRPMHQIKT